MKYFLFLSAFIIVSCTMSTPMKYATTPEQLNQGEYSYVPDLKEGSNNVILLNLSISHQDSLVIRAEDITVSLLDASGESFSVSNRTTGNLTHVGGSLGVTSNLQVEFNSTGNSPTELKIEHNDETLLFTVSEDK